MVESSTKTSSHAAPTAGRFGMFAGVFTPNVLTILGIILFLRIGWVVGQAGLWGALAIVVLANAISLLTGLSLSSIATSMRVKAGGNYYLISRTLGLEIGGAIGIPLFLSQAISIAFYIIGFTEALYTLEAVQQFDPRLISTVVAILFGIISYIGADFALKIQFFILAVLIASLVSFFAGGWGDIQAPILQGSFTEGVNFWIVFAVFFPAVTGIEVGVSMSGDLKDPSRDIPRGTILSILVTAVVYILAVIWFATHSSAETLINDNLAMQSIAVVPALILAGVWASTLSSALGSILAAPRTLQAIAIDKVVPRVFARQMGSATEPRVAVITSTAIAVLVIWLGDLNFVAPIISMFFLNTYGMVNLIASIEKLIGNPSFRPRFKIHWSLSLLGGIGCYAAMFLINTPATLIAILISYGIYFMLQRRQISRTWGDVRSGVLFALARNILLRLETSTQHVRNWHPNIIVFTGQPHNRSALVEVANWLSLGQGIVTFFQLITANVDDKIGRNLRATAHRNIRKYIREHNMQAFAEVEIASSFKEGATAVVQAHGIGGLKANSVLMGWSTDQAGRASQMSLMRSFVSMEKSVLFLHPDPVRGFGDRSEIQVWWQGEGGNADLMLLLSHLIKQHRDWEKSAVKLLRVIDNEEGRSATLDHMQSFIDEVRVAGEPVVLVRDYPGQPFSEILQRESAHCDLTLLGMHLPESDASEAYAERMNELADSVGSVLLVHNAQRNDDLLDTG